MTAPVLARPLSAKQHQVLVLIAEGYTKPEIGILLSIGETTVKAHTDAIFERLGAKNRANAVYLAMQAGELS